jgi:hypothetical protein
MKETLPVLKVSAKTDLDEIIKSFEDSKNDLILIDENSVIAQPHLDLLIDYPRSASAALVAAVKSGDTLVRQNRIASASSKSHRVTIGNRDFVGALRLSQNQRIEIVEALSNAARSGAIGNAIDLALVALVRAASRVDAADIWSAPYIRRQSD